MLIRNSLTLAIAEEKTELRPHHGGWEHQHQELRDRHSEGLRLQEDSQRGSVGADGAGPHPETEAEVVEKLRAEL